MADDVTPGRPYRSRRLRSLDARPRAGEPSRPDTFALVSHSGWTGLRRALAVAGAFALVVSAAGVVAQFGDDPPELVTIPAGPPSVRIRAEQAALALEHALDREEPDAIEAAATELRQQLSRLPDPEREEVAAEATSLLEAADRALDELPPTQPPNSTTLPPRTSTTAPAASTAPPTTTPGTNAPSTTAPPATTTTTTVPDTTSTTSTTTTTIPEPVAEGE